MQRIICFGDSITAGKPFAEGSRWTALLRDALDVEEPCRFEVYNRGIGGNTTADGLARYDADVKTLLPAIVLLEFGLNDASILPGRTMGRVGPGGFRENLLELIGLVRTGGGTPVLVANHPLRKSTKGSTRVPADWRRYCRSVAAYQEIIREVAALAGVPLIDLEAAMTKAKVRDIRLLSEDNLHLSKEGNAIYASFILEGLKPLIRS